MFELANSTIFENFESPIISYSNLQHDHGQKMHHAGHHETSSKAWRELTVGEKTIQEHGRFIKELLGSIGNDEYNDREEIDPYYVQTRQKELELTAKARHAPPEKDFKHDGSNDREQTTSSHVQTPLKGLEPAAEARHDPPKEIIDHDGSNDGKQTAPSYVQPSRKKLEHAAGAPNDKKAEVKRVRNPDAIISEKCVPRVSKLISDGLANPLARPETWVPTPPGTHTYPSCCLYHSRELRKVDAHCVSRYLRQFRYEMLEALNSGDDSIIERNILEKKLLEEIDGLSMECEPKRGA